jgi:uncharacterized protein (DUF1684 family)
VVDAHRKTGPAIWAFACEPGAIVFEHGGSSWRLDAILEAPGLTKADRIDVDFNEAFNPPCAFTDFATCPLPPEQNRLALAIDAGELKYERAH